MPALSTALLLFALVCPATQAAPVFSEVEVVSGLKIYPDSERTDLFYYAPVGFALRRVGDKPAFSFQRFRYVGRRVTGDSDRFFGRGVLSFTVEFISPRDDLGKASTILGGRLRRRVTLRPVPIAGIRSDLIYAAVEEGGTEETSGILSGGSWGGTPDSGDSEAGEFWDVRTFSIGADPYSTNLLWETYHNGNVVLALSVAVSAHGVNERRVPGGAEPISVVRTVFADSIRIEVSPRRYPGLFVSADINERMPAGYTFLDVYCYDFQSGFAQDEGIAQVIVEVRGRAISGDLPVERVVFSSSEPDVVKRSVHFRFAIDLNAGYSYRVLEVWRGGEITSGKWTGVSEWNGICDVSSSKSGQGVRPDAKPIDPKLLY